jgi:hypothetical protein
MPYRYNNLLRLTAERMMVIVPTVLGLDVEIADRAASGVRCTPNAYKWSVVCNGKWVATGR